MPYGFRYEAIGEGTTIVHAKVCLIAVLGCWECLQALPCSLLLLVSFSHGSPLHLFQASSDDTLVLSSLRAIHLIGRYTWLVVILAPGKPRLIGSAELA
jgi:hypothetical protein